MTRAIVPSRARLRRFCLLLLMFCLLGAGLVPSALAHPSRPPLINRPKSVLPTVWSAPTPAVQRGSDGLTDEKPTPLTDAERAAIVDGARAYLAEGPHAVAVCPAGGGVISGFECLNVDLLSWMPLNAFSSGPTSASNIWEYLAPDGREYAVIGVRNGTAVVDITDPANPLEVGLVPGYSSTWREVKTYNQFAYISTEASGQGMQIIDLRDLPQSIALVNTYTGNGLGTIHTLSIDAQNGYLYLNGSNLANGGLIILDVHTDPIHPVEVGRWSTRYVHDSQIVTYPPNHPTYANRQIAFLYTGAQGIDIVDVTNKAALVLLSHTTYTGLAYSHQGWLTPNFQYIYQDDELDEQNNLVNNMTTRIFDVSNLSSPQLAGMYVANNKTIDHNLYIRDNFVYESDYRNGLQILNISAPTAPVLTGYFDTYPGSNSTAFNGNWGNTPFLPSGHIILADIERGLFVLRFNELPGSTTFTIGAAPQALNVCAGGSAQSTISIGQIRDFLPTVNLSASNLQPEITANFGASSLLPGSSTNLTLNVTPNLEPGNYPVRITGASGAVSYYTDLSLNVVSGLLAAPTLLSPANGGNSGVLATLSWQALAGASAYHVQVFDNPFLTGAPLVDTTVSATSFAIPNGLLNANGHYTWRVATVGACGEGAFSAPRTFTTVANLCQELLLNNGFESGSNPPGGPPWVWSTENTQTVIRQGPFLDDGATIYPHSGAWAARLGGYNNIGPTPDSLYQPFSIPAGYTATLSLWWQMRTQEQNTGTQYDFFRVKIKDAGGNDLQTVYSGSNTSPEGVWQLQTLDLTGSAGSTLRLFADITTDQSLATWLYLDDTSVSACAPSAPTCTWADVNCSCNVVDVRDIQLMAEAWRDSTVNGRTYSQFDVNSAAGLGSNDGLATIVDIQAVLTRWNTAACQ